MNKFIENVLNVYDLEKAEDLIYEILPRDYNTPALFANIKDIPNLPDKMKITTFGYIDSFEQKILSGRKSLVNIKAKLYKDGESVNLQWTTTSQKAKSMMFGLKMKAKPEMIVQVSGKINSFETNSGFIYKYLEQPILNTIEDTNNTTQAILLPEPIYKLKTNSDIKNSITIQNAFRELVKNFDFLDKSDLIPLELEKRLNMQDLKTSLQYIHGLKPIPINKFQDFMEYDGYRKRLLSEKIWKMLKISHMSKVKKTDKKIENFINENSINNIKRVLTSLNFELTGDQKKAIWGLLNSFVENRKGKNLIFGDVGSGKTLVSLIVSYVMYELGFQVAIITPTSILAKQHFEEAKEILFDKNIEIVHSKTTKKEKERINKLISSGKPIIVYGTTSVNKLEFSNLGVVFIDEEQKFGVHDKEVLYKNNNAHIVYMTATPIPRTLASSLYTDFNIFKINQKPAMQKPRKTKVIENLSQEEIDFIKNKVKNGEQILVIVPAIASNDLVSSAFAEKKYKKLFPEFRLDKINGRMKPQNIEKTTEDFMKGKIDLLIATTMVDAGFSNKNLSFVFIENADRFGIAQMHQIRGRVGRGDKQGYCFLIPANKNMKDKTRDRLNSLVESENGFELSMKDIELRGSGDILGLEQSGSELNVLEWINEINEMNKFLNGD